MKFKYYLEQISGVSVYPLISLMLFVSFFIIVTIWVFRTNSKTIEYIEKLPLDND